MLPQRSEIPTPGFQSSLSDGCLELRLRGTILVRDDKGWYKELLKLVAHATFQSLVLNLSEVDHMDSSGVALLISLRQTCNRKKVPFELRGANKDLQGFLSLLDLEKLAGLSERITRPRPQNPFVSLGNAVLSFLSNLRFIVTFIGDILVSSAYTAVRPRSFRFQEMIECFERSGANALPIITLIHFLVGLVLAFQASIQLRQFGANIFVADLVGLAQVREFGPLITAVLLAGRSGSAFAAEIGTMQVNEEIDALKTMGLDPTRFLVLPKTMALLLAMPLLTLYADLVGIAGGLVVGVLSLDLTVQGYLLQTRKAVDMFDVFSGVGKTLAFALIVAGVGCLRGFQVRGGAESVGHAATSAVVSGIFLIILVDAIFTVIFQYV